MIIAIIETNELCHDCLDDTLANEAKVARFNVDGYLLCIDHVGNHMSTPWHEFDSWYSYDEDFYEEPALYDEDL